MPARLAFTLLVLLATTSVVHAGEAISFTSVTGGFADGAPRVVGWEFTTGSQPISVTQLGVYDHNKDGLLASHDMAIYDFQTKNPVVTATVPAGTLAALTGVFRYVPVNTTVLLPNTEYVIAAGWLQNADQQVWANGQPGLPPANISDLSISSAISLGLTISGLSPSGRFECCTTSTLEFPDQRIGDVFPGDTRTMFVGPNFTFVPEPASAVLGLVGSLFAMAVPPIRTRRTGVSRNVIRESRLVRLDA